MLPLRTSAAALALALAATPAPAATPGDPLAAEVAAWAAFARDTNATDELSRAVKPQAATVLAQAQAALAAGRRAFALHRLSAVRSNLGGLRYVGTLGAGATSDSVFAAEWARTGALLHADSAARFDTVTPAEVRAVAEAAYAQIGHLHEASLEYGQSTMASTGLFYIGATLGHRDFVTFCRSLATAEARRAPPLRSLARELTALQDTMLRAYRPPASVDRHPEFIAASAALKEARELDARGLRHGALLRYLQAVARTAPLLATGPPPAHGVVAGDLAAFRSRVSDRAVDHGIGRLFVEMAETEQEASRDTSSALAVAIVGDVLPRYFAALEPARAVPSAGAPEVTVTLVRWPFT